MSIFYNINKLSLLDKKNILIEANQIAEKVIVNELDVKKSWLRQKSGISAEKIIQDFCCDPHHFVFIHRPASIDFDGQEYFEVGLSTLGHSPEYFLFLNLSLENGNKLIKKYQLETINSR